MIVNYISSTSRSVAFRSSYPSKPTPIARYANQPLIPRCRSKIRRPASGDVIRQGRKGQANPCCYSVRLIHCTRVPGRDTIAHGDLCCVSPIVIGTRYRREIARPRCSLSAAYTPNQSYMFPGGLVPVCTVSGRSPRTQVALLAARQRGICPVLARTSAAPRQTPLGPRVMLSLAPRLAAPIAG